MNYSNGDPISEFFSDSGPNDPKNVIGAQHARETAQRKRRPVIETTAMRRKRTGEPLPTLPPIEHQVHYAPEVRARRFFPLACSVFILLLVGGSAVIFIPALPTAVSAAQTDVATFATLPTQTATRQPTATYSPTVTPFPTAVPSKTLTPTPRPTNTPTLTPSKTPTPDLNATAEVDRANATWYAMLKAATETKRAIWATHTPSQTATVTSTPTATATPTVTPTITPTVAPAVVFAPVATEYKPALLDLKCLTLGLVVFIGSGMYWLVRRSPEVDPVEESEKPENAEEVVVFDAEDERLRQTLKSVRKTAEQAAFEPYRQLFLAIVELDNFSARHIAEVLQINKEQAAAATRLMRQLGALKLRGETVQTGYVLAADRESVIARLKRVSIVSPFPDWPCPDFVVPSGRHDKTEDTGRHEQTKQTERQLVFGSDGKPIL
jgi:hypothetical protein